MDFFVVPTIGFDLLYAFVIIRLDPGESGEGTYPVTTLARKSSSQAATLRFSRREFLPGVFRSRLWAKCLMVVKLAGA